MLAASAYLRVFAAISIVWYHVALSPLSNEIGAIGLTIFLYLSCMHSGLHHGIWVPLSRFTKQLLVPWAVWWLFYGVVAFWLSRGVPPKLANRSSTWQLLTDWPANHLWYLPTIFVFSMSLLGIRKVLEPIPQRTKAVLAILGGLGLLLLVAEAGRTALPEIIVYAMPSAPLGLAYGYCMRLDSQRHRLGAFVAIAAVVSLMCVPIWLSGNHVVAVGYSGGSLLMILCALPVPRQRAVMRLSVLTLGIYLIHPFAQLVLWKFVGKSTDWLFALETLILSGLLTWALRRVRYLQRIV